MLFNSAIPGSIAGIPSNFLFPDTQSAFARADQLVALTRNLDPTVNQLARNAEIAAGRQRQTLADAFIPASGLARQGVQAPIGAPPQAATLVNQGGVRLASGTTAQPTAPGQNAPLTKAQAKRLKKMRKKMAEKLKEQQSKEREHAKETGKTDNEGAKAQKSGKSEKK